MAETSPTIGRARGEAGYEPDVPITTSPILDWPPRP